MSKSKYSHPTFLTVKAGEPGDTSKDTSRVDRSGTRTSGPTSRSNADKGAAGTLLTTDCNK
jgi:hypothetical protein